MGEGGRQGEMRGEMRVRGWGEGGRQGEMGGGGN